MREAYAIGKRVWAAKPDATVWAGARFYDRSDVHITDFWYRDPSGFGGGILGRARGSMMRTGMAPDCCICGTVTATVATHSSNSACRAMDSATLVARRARGCISLH